MVSLDWKDGWLNGWLVGLLLSCLFCLLLFSPKCFDLAKGIKLLFGEQRIRQSCARLQTPTLFSAQLEGFLSRFRPL